MLIPTCYFYTLSLSKSFLLKLNEFFAMNEIKKKENSMEINYHFVKNQKRLRLVLIADGLALTSCSICFFASSLLRIS